MLQRVIADNKSDAGDVVPGTEANSGTIILDEIENVDPERKPDVLAILNVGFERGGEVPRCERAGDSFVNRRFAVYCPKVIAGIKTLPRTLHTRVLQIQMPKRKPTEYIENFEPDRLAPWAGRLRDDQAIFALRNAVNVAEMYQGRSELLPSAAGGGDRPSLDDRLRDILAPLYAIAAVIDHEAGSLVATQALDRFAAAQAGLRQSDAFEDDFALGVHALVDWAAPQWDRGKVLITVEKSMSVFKAAGIDGADVRQRPSSFCESSEVSTNRSGGRAGRRVATCSTKRI